MNWIVTVYIAVLFFVLTPGVLVYLPPKSSKLVVAAFHAVVFALIWHFTHKIVWQMSAGLEGFTEGFKKTGADSMLTGRYGPDASKPVDRTCVTADDATPGGWGTGTAETVGSSTKGKKVNCVANKWQYV